jgi:hypothetical protein
MNFAPNAFQMPTEIAPRAGHGSQVQEDPDPAVARSHMRQTTEAFAGVVRRA